MFFIFSLMMNFRSCIPATFTSLFIFLNVAGASEFDLSGSVAIENKVFVESALMEEQLSTLQTSVELEPELSWNKEDLSFYLAPVIRLDAVDDGRSHVNFREAYVRWFGEDITISAGHLFIFWGVTESRHLTDVINQWDARDDINPERKLGQMALEITRQTDVGDFSFYYMPYFHQRSHPEEKARLRFLLPIMDEHSQYPDGKTSIDNPDLALRYSHFFGNWDIGLSFFHGTERSPRFNLSQQMTVGPVYDHVEQFGIDLQYTSDAWLWKAEAVYKNTPTDNYFASVAGFEYTFYGIANSSVDMGFLTEYQFDGRSDDFSVAPPVLENNDVFVGARIAFNNTADTSIITGLVTDVENGALYGSLEAASRLSDDLMLEIEGRYFIASEEDLFLSALNRDSHISIRLKRFF